MKAVILAGGRGERLRPITDTRPKPLVPVLARPVMDYCLSLLAHHGTTEAYVTTHYLADQIRHRYGESAFGIHLSYAAEDTPLGTAGGVKRLERELSEEEYFLVMSGDALCDFDLKSAVAFHLKKKADVTIILSSVKTPLEYGVILADTFEKIFAFSEKPDWCETFSDQVNTGVYILSPKILSLIPDGKEFDFSRDLFPLLLQNGYSLFGYKDSGYWCDIGQLSTLYRCNMDLLQGKIKTYLEPVGEKKTCSDGKGYYFVSNGATVEEGAVIGNGSVLSPGAHLASGAQVEASLVLEKVKLEKGAQSRQSVLCEKTTLRENAISLPGTVLGAGSTVQPGGITAKGKKYPPFSVVSCRPVFRDEGLVFTERGISSDGERGLKENELPDLGAALASAFHKDICIFWDEKEPQSASFATLLASGVSRGGKNAVLAGEGFDRLASYGASLLRLPSVYVSAKDGRAVVFGFEEDGLPFTRKATLCAARHFSRKEVGEYGKVELYPNLRDKYVHSLSDLIGQSPAFSISISGSEASPFRKAAILSGFRAYDGAERKELRFEMFSTGLKIFSGEERVADTEKARLFLIRHFLSTGRKNFVLPHTAPRFFSHYIRSRGGTVHIFSMDQTTREEGKIRQLAQKERWLYDENFLAAHVLSLLKGKEEKEIREEFSSLPEIYISSLEYIPAEETKAKLLGEFYAQKEETRKARIHPGFHSIRIVSEALSFEAALENAFECRGNLYEIEEKLKGR